MLESPRFRLVSAENLTEPQRRCVDRYVSLSQTTGVLVSALVGTEGWDARPVLLEGDKLYVLRFSNPALALDKDRMRSLGQLQERLFQGVPPPGVVSVGEVAGQRWLKRRFYNDLLSDEAFLKQYRANSRAFVGKLVQLVSNLHQHRNFHGHLTLANLAMEGDAPVILDYGFYAHSGRMSVEGWATEGDRILPLRPTIDVFGLGHILKRLIELAPAGEFSAGTEQFVTRMTAPVEARLSLDEVRTFFAATTTSSGAGRTLVRDAPLRSGKFIAEDISAKNHSAKKYLETFSQPIWMAAAVLVVVLAIFLSRTPTTDSIPYDEYWNSNQESLMRQVAEAAALHGDTRARLVIMKGLGKSNGAGLREVLVKSAFNADWEGQLTDGDRDAVYRLALAKLVPEGVRDLPPLDTVNGAVLFALLADAPVTADLGAFGKFSIEKLTTLPDLYGEAFSVLQKEGVKTLGEGATRGLAHILAGQSDSTAFDAYFSSGDPGVRILVLLPFMGKVAGIETGLEGYWKGSQGILADKNRWFFAEDVAGWSKQNPATRIRLVGGIAPERNLTLEQYSDLLLFPDPNIRQLAERSLLQNFFSEADGPTIRFLGSERNQLSRFQTVSLLAGLKFNGEARFTFMSKWFESRPEIYSVLGILLARSNAKGVDPFNVEAGRYLANASWSTGIKELALLARHPEDLARALAYARLDPSKLEERQILLGASRTERVKRLKDELEDRLKNTPLAQGQGKADK